MKDPAIRDATCPICGAPVVCTITENIHSRRNEFDFRYKKPPAPKPTLCGYQMEQLLMVADLLQRHGVAPEDLHDLKNNFQFAFDILRKEQERIQRAAMEQMLQNFQPGSSLPDLDTFREVFPDIKLKKEEPKE